MVRLRMLLTRRIPLLLAALGVAVLLSWLALEHAEQRSLERLYAGISAGRQSQLEQALDQTGATLRNFTRHHSPRRILPRIEANDRSLANLLEDYDIDGLWVLDAAGGRLASHRGNPADILPDLPPAPDLAKAFAAAGDRNVHFFLRDGTGGIHEVYGHAWKVRTPEEPQLWLLGVSGFDSDRLRSISSLSGTICRLSPGHQDRRILIEEGRMHFHVPLPGLDGQPVALLDADYRGSELEELNERVRIDTWIFLGALAGLLAGVALSLRHWVVLPLRRISRALITGDTAPLNKLDRRHDEFQHIASLIRESFANREELRRTIDERARLGRDLHDGAIQSIYAAGMSLARARAAAGHQPEESLRIIDGVRENLNATIRELREFINQTEPGPIEGRGFAEVAAELLRQLRTEGVELTLAVDEAVAAARPTADRVQVLQLIREAASNALRHGGATVIGISWRPEGEGSVLEIMDNGRGFDATAPGEGRGLANMTERARQLGATLRIDSDPRQGTRVGLHFPAPARP